MDYRRKTSHQNPKETQLANQVTTDQSANRTPPLPPGKQHNPNHAKTHTTIATSKQSAQAQQPDRTHHHTDNREDTTEMRASMPKNNVCIHAMSGYRCKKCNPQNTNTSNNPVAATESPGQPTPQRRRSERFQHPNYKKRQQNEKNQGNHQKDAKHPEKHHHEQKNQENKSAEKEQQDPFKMLAQQVTGYSPTGYHDEHFQSKQPPNVQMFECSHARGMHDKQPPRKRRRMCCDWAQECKEPSEALDET